MNILNFIKELVLHYKIIVNLRIRIVEHPEYIVTRVALCRDFASFADQLGNRLNVDLMRCARRGYYILLNHGAAKIIAAILQGQLADLRPHRNP
ncbi:hypothetical protein D3C75_1161660 [compost metagenome]